MHYLLNIEITNKEMDKNKFKNLDFKYIFLGNTVNNRILENGKFTRLYYSTPLCSFNGIYTLIHLDNINESNESNTQNSKLLINTEMNANMIKKIKELEETILAVINIKNKRFCSNIYNEISKGFIKLNYKYNIQNIMLKISGIWETETSYGLSYKYYYLKDVFA